MKKGCFSVVLRIAPCVDLLKALWILRIKEIFFISYFYHSTSKLYKNNELTFIGLKEALNLRDSSDQEIFTKLRDLKDTFWFRSAACCTRSFPPPSSPCIRRPL